MRSRSFPFEQDKPGTGKTRRPKTDEPESVARPFCFLAKPAERAVLFAPKKDVLSRGERRHWHLLCVVVSKAVEGRWPIQRNFGLYRTYPRKKRRHDHV